MKLTSKILSWLLAATAVVMFVFTYLAIHMLETNLKEESLKSHKLVYSLFLPTITKFLWEFDISGIKDTLSNIVDNEHAQQIYIFDTDVTLITSLQKNPETQKTENVQLDSKQSEKVISKSTKEKIESEASKNINFYIYYDNIGNKVARIIGPMLHKKKADSDPSLIGFLVLDYSTANISKAVNEMIRGVVILSFCFTFILVVAIGVLLRSTLIKNIIRLNQASIDISRGKYVRIEENKKDKDELAELVKNFNIMTNQIESNQENLKILGEESIKVSSLFSIQDIAKQFSESVKKITKVNLKMDFYAIHYMLDDKSKKDGFYEILLNENHENSFISIEDSTSRKENKKRFYIRDNATGEDCAIVQIDDLRNVFQFSYTASEAIYSSIQALLTSASNALDNIRFMRDQNEQRRLVGEQETARLVQNNLMPKSDYRDVQYFELANHFEPAEECAGDWWSYYSLPENKLLLLLGDVTGHGTASALMTAVVKGYCDSIQTQPHIKTNEILSQLDYVIRHSGDGNKVMTMFSASLDPKNGTLEYSNAAHNFPMLIKKKSDKVEIKKLIAQGKPLGFASMAEDTNDTYTLYESKKLNLDNEDVVCIYSDGLVEALNMDGEEFGERRLKNILTKNSDCHVKDIKDKIIDAAREFIYPNKFSDDVTFLVCRFKK